MRLVPPPAFFLGAYVRLAQLGGLGLFVLGAGAAQASPIVTPGAASYGIAQAAVGLVLFGLHALVLTRVPKTEYETLLRRAHLTLGALAFLAGAALFLPLGISRAAIGMPAAGEATVAALSLVLFVAFGIGLLREVSRS